MRFLYLLILNKWYFDELYDVIFRRPVIFLSRLLWASDVNLIDRYGPDGISQQTRNTSRLLSFFESGYIYHYAIVMMIGLFSFVSWYVFFRMMG